MRCDYRLEVERIRKASSAIVGQNARVAEGERVLRIPPLELAMPTGYPLDTYALGRMVASEWASGPPPALLAIAEVARNTTRARGVGLFELLTKDKNPDEQGLFGVQGGPTARYASTARPPTERTMVAAEIALESNTGIAGGAGRFVHPKGFPTIARALEVYDSWTSEGWRFVAGAPLYDGWCLDPYTFFLLGRAGVTVRTASVEAGRRILESAGRA